MEQHMKYIIPSRRSYVPQVFNGTPSNSGISYQSSAQGATPTTTVSPNYLGNPDLAANQSADCPESLSCSLWVLNLPHDTEIYEILNTIRGYGRIIACVVNPPSQPEHITAAAKIVFFEHKAAQAMYRHSKSNPALFAIRGLVPRIYMNRIRTAESNLPIFHSRVLMIRGPRHLVNQSSLAIFFNQSDIAFETEVVLQDGNTAPGHIALEWRFGSYRAQAIAAFWKLKGSKVHADAGVTVDFGNDPCWLPLIPGVGIWSESTGTNVPGREMHHVNEDGD